MNDSDELFISLYLDEDVTDRLAILLQQRGFKAVSAASVGMIGQRDEEHLLYTATHELTVFTYNAADYIQLAQEWAIQGRTHTGILLSEQFSVRQIGELLRRVLTFLNRVTADEMINSVRYLGEFKDRQVNLDDTTD